MLEEIRVISSDICLKNEMIDPNRAAYYVIEEAGEVTKELTKGLRGNLDRHKLAEEVADLYYALSMLRQKHDINVDEINTWLLIKEDKARTVMKIGTYADMPDGDCTECQSFTTSPVIYPSGKCLDGKLKLCGVGFTCENFKPRGGI